VARIEWPPEGFRQPVSIAHSKREKRMIKILDSRTYGSVLTRRAWRPQHGFHAATRAISPCSKTAYGRVLRSAAFALDSMPEG
jgi:hypothetical protein